MPYIPLISGPPARKLPYMLHFIGLIIFWYMILKTGWIHDLLGIPRPKKDQKVEVEDEDEEEHPVTDFVAQFFLPQPKMPPGPKTA
jgi:hypothetical protein